MRKSKNNEWRERYETKNCIALGNDYCHSLWRRILRRQRHGSIGQGPTVAADNAEIHIVEEGETLWDIARSVADDRGQDIRETIYEIQINNDINEVDSLRPGQKIIIR